MRNVKAARRLAADGLVRSVDRALTLLDAFAQPQTSWGVSELAAATRLSKTAVFRLLRTLERHGYTVQDGARRYTLGTRPLVLAGSLLRRLGVRDVGRPIMTDLARQTGESVVLTAPASDGVVCLEAVDSTQPLRLSAQVGSVTPYHAGATGKVHLAHLRPEDVRRVLARRLRRYTERTITDPDVLKRQVDEIRRAGHAASWGELDGGVAAIAAPVFNAGREAVAVLSVAGPASRFTSERLPGLVTAVRGAASAISNGLARADTPENVDHESEVTER